MRESPGTLAPRTGIFLDVEKVAYTLFLFMVASLRFLVGGTLLPVRSLGAWSATGPTTPTRLTPSFVAKASGRPGCADGHELLGF
jgi:hypothetical protein